MQSKQNQKKNGNRKAGNRQTLSKKEEKELSAWLNSNNKQTLPISKKGPLVSAPVAKTRAIRTNKPQMRSHPNGNCTVRHREYVMDLIGGTGNPSQLKVEGFAINPGLGNLFPWLAAIASRFEKYRFKYLKFTYETDCPSSLGGAVIIGVDYDANDAVPLSKQQILEFKNSVRTAPWSGVTHISAKEDLHQQNQYYVRGLVPVQGADTHTYDTGYLWLASQNVTASSQILGEIFVEYEVELITPTFEVNVIQGSVALATAPVNAANPWGTTNVVVGAYTMRPSGTSMFFDGLTVGAVYLVAWQDSGTGISALALSAGTFCVSNWIVSSINGAGTFAMAAILIRPTATTCSVVCAVTATTLVAGGNITNLAQVPRGLAGYSDF